MLNTKEDILKNVGNQTVAGPHWLSSRKKVEKKKKVTGDQQLFGYCFHLWVNYSFNVNKIKCKEKNNSQLLTEEP